MDIKHVGDRECISCGDCIDVCPVNAISWKGVKVQPCKDSKKRIVVRIVIGVLLAALLAGAIGYYWNQESAPNLPIGGDRGNQVGDLCVDYDLEVVTGEAITADLADPTETGKITIINFWGTWCTPCVNELPYFHQIATDYADSVAVFAIHTNMVSETAPAYIADHYPDSLITFARDGEAEAYYTALGGRGTYPYTVVLDRNGTIVKVFWESLHYEDLQAVVEEHLN